LTEYGAGELMRADLCRLLDYRMFISSSGFAPDFRLFVVGGDQFGKVQCTSEVCRSCPTSIHLGYLVRSS
jgi:hypothetical protein